MLDGFRLHDARPGNRASADVSSSFRPQSARNTVFDDDFEPSVRTLSLCRLSNAPNCPMRWSMRPHRAPDLAQARDLWRGGGGVSKMLVVDPLRSCRLKVGPPWIGLDQTDLGNLEVWFM